MSGIVLWRAEYELHDYLSYASRSGPGYTATEPILHGWGLSFALACYRGQRIEPDYDADLANMPVFALPADVDKSTYREKITPHNAVIPFDPSWVEVNYRTVDYVQEILPDTIFRGYFFAAEGWLPPAFIRCGKGRSLVEVRAEPVAPVNPIFLAGPHRLSHSVVSLDFNEATLEKGLTWIRIPPAPIWQRPTVREFYGMKIDDQVIGIPDRIIEGRIAQLV